MSLHYILDGYNVIHKLPNALKQDKLEGQRDYLVRFIEMYQPQGSANNRVTIVFDGKSEFASLMAPSTLQIVFSKDETADDWIKRFVEDSKVRNNIVVITNDRDIQYMVRALGARFASVDEFLAKAKSKARLKYEHLDIKLSAAKKKSLSEPKKVKDISENIQNKITSELKNIWLKKEKE